MAIWRIFKDITKMCHIPAKFLAKSKMAVILYTAYSLDLSTSELFQDSTWYFRFND
jgi:hypothetical protein